MTAPEASRAPISFCSDQMPVPPPPPFIRIGQNTNSSSGTSERFKSDSVKSTRWSSPSDRVKSTRSDSDFVGPCFSKSSDSVLETAEKTLSPLLNLPTTQNNNTIPIDEILAKPGRDSRPKKIVIILRGPPGSGKTFVAKLMKEKEVSMGGSAPRILSIDDYFMTEVDKEEKCPKTGRKVRYLSNYFVFPLK